MTSAGEAKLRLRMVLAADRQQQGREHSAKDLYYFRWWDSLTLTDFRKLYPSAIEQTWSWTK